MSDGAIWWFWSLPRRRAPQWICEADPGTVWPEGGARFDAGLFAGKGSPRADSERVDRERPRDRGVDCASAEAGRDLYATFVKGEIILTDATTAEMVKLMENTYRDVNIALANEFALLAEQVGIDVWQAIRLANYHPRVRILKPGPGVGGHCIAVDPWFLVEAARQQARLILQARLVNDGMPEHVVKLVQRAVDGFRSIDRVSGLDL